MKKITQKMLDNKFPRRKKNSNKSDFGHALIIGGSKKYVGAGVLSTLAATRTGAGYVHLMSDLKYFDVIKYPDFIIEDFSLKNLKSKKFTSIGIGPGLGLDSHKEKILKLLKKDLMKKVVVDADALTLLAKLKWQDLPAEWILTPHEGELARLLDVNISLIKKDRQKYLKLAHEKFQCHIILKGAETLMIDAKGVMYKSRSGHPCLAKAGSGDVLTGILTALFAQGLNSLDTMLLGTEIHGLAARQFIKSKRDEASLRPLDLIENIPLVLKKFKKK